MPRAGVLGPSARYPRWWSGGTGSERGVSGRLPAPWQSGWDGEPCPGTLRPAAEDGVRQPGAALGAPHQLQQLFGHFGHDGDWARGSLLPGLRPRNIGKGRVEKGAAERRPGGRARRGTHAAAGTDRACQARRSRNLEFPVPEVAGLPTSFSSAPPRSTGESLPRKQDCVELRDRESWESSANFGNCTDSGWLDCCWLLPCPARGLREPLLSWALLYFL